MLARKFCTEPFNESVFDYDGFDRTVAKYIGISGRRALDHVTRRTGFRMPKMEQRIDRFADKSLPGRLGELQDEFVLSDQAD
jgi:hypothetical protein